MRKKHTVGKTILIGRNHGFSIVEVLIAALLLGIMIVGMSQLMSVGFDQQQVDIRQKMAALAVNNGAERFLSTVRDNCGPKSFTGSSIGGCTSGKTYSRTYDGTENLSPIPPELMTLCPKCRLQVAFTCDSANRWQGYVRMFDTDTGKSEILASVTPVIHQPLCN